MYRSDLDTKDRGGAIAAVAAIHAGLLFALMQASGTIDITDPQSTLRVFDISEPPPPPISEPVRQQAQPEEREKPKEAEGAASPKNIRSQATPIVDPKPRIELPLPVPMAVSETPRQGAQATQGAADVRGPGTGAGGTGTGTGSGGSGSGSGGGGGGVAVPPSLVRGITNRDFPPEIQRRWPRGGQIFLRLRIEPNGRPSQCDVMRSYGDPIADQWSCRLVMERGLFRPAVDRRGVPVSAWFGYVQSDRRPGGR